METQLSTQQLMNAEGLHCVREHGYLRSDLQQELEVFSYDNGRGAVDVQVGIADHGCGGAVSLRLTLCPEDAAALRDMLTNALARLDAVAIARADQKGGAQ